MLVARGLYRRWLTKYFSTVTLAGLAPDDEPILLRRIYVPLVLTPEKISDNVPEEEVHNQGKPLAGWLKPQEETQVFLISGEAGSGKTTLVSAVVDSLASEVRDDLNRQFEGYVPFPILLREAPLRDLLSLTELVDWWLGEAKKEIPDLEIESLRAFLDMGKGFLLLDGLDEVGTLEERARVMRWVPGHRWVAGLRNSFSREPLVGEGVPPNVVLVTARPSGFEGLQSYFPTTACSLFVAPFSHEQIRTYLTRWFELRPLRSQQRQGTVEMLFNRLTSSQQAGRLLPLARRPAYLASLAFVHGTRGELPYTRAALYEQLVDAYIEMLDRQRGLLDRAEQTGDLPIWDRLEKVEILAAVAFQAHVGATSKQKEKQVRGYTEEDRRILWSREELEAAVRLAVEGGAERFRTVRPQHVSQLTDYFVSRTGLLVESREGRYQFGHLSFQEYLTALFVLNRAAAGGDKAAALESILFSRLSDPGWLEVGMLTLAIDATRSGGKGHEPVLARLDLNLSDQLAFLAEILSGEEIRLTAEERRAWLFVWLGFWAAREDNSDLRSVLRFSPNLLVLEEVWEHACRAVSDKKPIFLLIDDLVSRALENLTQEAPPAQRNLDLLVGAPTASSLPSESSPPAQAWKRLRSSSKEDLAAGRLLVIPLLANFWPERWEESLVSLVDHAKLFLPGEPSRATEVQFALDSWSIHSERLLKALAERSSLLWWLQDEYFLARIHFSLEQTPLSPLASWRLALTRQVFRCEQVWRVSLLLSATSHKGRELDQVVAWKTARITPLQLDWMRALDRDLSRLIFGDKALAFALVRNRDWWFDRILEQCLNRSLVWDLARIRERASIIPYHKEAALQLFSVAALAILAGLFDKKSKSPILRSFVEKDLASLATEAPAFPLAGTPFHQQALEEWRQVLDSPLSPLPFLNEALKSNWREIPINPQQIIKLLDKVVTELEREAAKAADAEAKEKAKATQRKPDS